MKYTVLNLLKPIKEFLHLFHITILKRKYILPVMSVVLCAAVVMIAVPVIHSLQNRIISKSLSESSYSSTTIELVSSSMTSELISTPVSGLSSEVSETATSIESEITISRNPQIPEWYVPGDLTVMTLLNNTNNSKLNAGTALLSNLQLGLKFNTAQNVSNRSSNTANTSITLPNNTVINADIPCDADFVALLSSGDYPEGSGIYFNIKNRKTICFSDQAKKASINAGFFPSGGYIQIYYSDPASGNCIVEIRTVQSQTQGFYFFNIYDGRFSKFPVDLNQAGLLIFSPDKKNVATISLNPDMFNEVTLIDISKATPQKISISNNAKISLKPSMQASFSGSGRYLVYGACDDNGQLADANGVTNLAVYNIKAQTTIRIKGNFVRFINNESAIILENQGIGKVVDSNTGEDVTGKITLKNWQKWKVRITTEDLPNQGYTQSATLVPLFGNAGEITPVNKASAVFTAEEYIYSYRAGDGVITCYSIDNGKQFTVSVNENFLEQIKKIDQTKFCMEYGMGMSIDMTRLLLFYSTEDLIKEDTDNGFTDSMLGKLFRSVSSLAELKDYVDSGKDIPLGLIFDPAWNPYKTMKKFYIVKGDGYTSLILVSESYAFIAVEDYRDKTFSLYWSVNFLPWDTYPLLYNGSFEDTAIGIRPYRKTLSIDATQEKTVQIYSDLTNIDPYYDYASFYTAGTIDQAKISKWLCRPELATQSEGAFINDCSTIEKAVYGYDILDRDTLASMMQKIVDNTTYIAPSYNYEMQFPSIGVYSIGKGKMAYAIRLSMKSKFTNQYKTLFEFELGTNKDGNYYIHTWGGYAYIDLATYTDYINSCKALYDNATS